METFSNNQLKLYLRLRAVVCVFETTNDIRQITFVTVMSITTDVATIYYTHMNRSGSQHQWIQGHVLLQLDDGCLISETAIRIVLLFL